MLMEGMGDMEAIVFLAEEAMEGTEGTPPPEGGATGVMVATASKVPVETGAMEETVLEEGDVEGLAAADLKEMEQTETMEKRDNGD
jgi:hypothetical protein